MLWPAYDLKKKTYLRFVSPENRIENSYLKTECDFFDKIGYYFWKDYKFLLAKINSDLR